MPSSDEPELEDGMAYWKPGEYRQSDIQDCYQRTWGDQRRYECLMRDGRKILLESVTSILNIISKPSLPHHYAKKAAWDYRARLQAGQAYTAEELDQMASLSVAAADRHRDEAATLGTRAHDIIETYLRHGQWLRFVPETGEFAELDLRAEPVEVQNAIRLWREWWQSQRLTVQAVERVVVDIETGYAGTLDFVALDEAGNCVLLDWKTSKRIYDSAHLQVTAYAAAHARMGLGRIRRAVIARVGKDDAEFEEREIFSDREQALALLRRWEAALDLHRWRKEIERQYPYQKRRRAA